MHLIFAWQMDGTDTIYVDGACALCMVLEHVYFDHDLCICGIDQIMRFCGIQSKSHSLFYSRHISISKAYILNVHWKYSMFGIENRPICVKWNDIKCVKSDALPMNKYRAKFAWAILKIGDNETVQKNSVSPNCLNHSILFEKKKKN